MSNDSKLGAMEFTSRLPEMREARRQGALVSASYADDADAQWWLDRVEAELAAFYRDEP